jgi:hypothetical protein
MRILFWIIICRIELICYDFHFLEDYGELSSLETLAETGILLLKKNVSKYTMLEFWKSLVIVIAKMNNVIYRKDFCFYIKCLMSRCGRFVGVSFDDTSAKDYTLLIKEDENHNGFFVTTEYMWRETERMFYYITLAIYNYKQLTLSVTPRSFSFHIENFYGWLDKNINGIYCKYILQKISDSIYEVNIKRGDTERFKETNKFGVANPYNVISTFRNNELDLISTRICHTLVEDIIKIEKTNYSKNWYTNEEFVLLCYITVGFAFDAKYPNSGITKYFVMGDVTKERFIVDDNEFPIIKKVFNEYGVSYKGICVPQAKFSYVFAYWIWIICNEPGLNGKIPFTDFHLTDIYTDLFPDDKVKIDYLYRINNADMMLTVDIIKPPFL